MDDEFGTYAPQSPDLSGFQTYNEPDPFSSHQTAYYPPQHPQYDTSHYQQPPNHDPFQFTSPQPSHYQQSTVMPPANGKGRAKVDPLDDDFAPEPSTTAKASGGRRSKKMKTEAEVCAKPAPGVEEGIEVKTKFPVARIKRIMQADEDVGKVAQVTPTAVCESPPPLSIPVVMSVETQHVLM